MPFAAGFILFFVLDIFVSSRFTSIGLMPMTYLIGAVSLFVSIILFRANPAIFDRGERRLNRIWILCLLTISVLEFLANMQMHLAQMLSSDIIRLSQIFDAAFFGISLILAVSTILEKHPTGFYRWQVFAALSNFLQSVLPVTVWRVMPEKVYLYYGLIQLPMLFGLLMMIDSVLKRRYQFAAVERE